MLLSVLNKIKGKLMAKAWKMDNEAIITTYQSILMGTLSFIIAHLPEIQAFITFSLTVLFLYYKIREARAKAELAENDKGNKNSSCSK